MKQNINFNYQKKTGLKNFNDSKAFTEYPNDMDDIYKNLDGYNLNKKRKVLIVFHDVVADVLKNRKAQSNIN